MTEPKDSFIPPKPLTFDADLRVLRANRSFYRAFRVAPEERRWAD